MAIADKYLDKVGLGSRRYRTGKKYPETAFQIIKIFPDDHTGLCEIYYEGE